MVVIFITVNPAYVLHMLTYGMGRRDATRSQKHPPIHVAI